jgi:hypothetical protein
MIFPSKTSPSTTNLSPRIFQPALLGFLYSIVFSFFCFVALSAKACNGFGGLYSLRWSDDKTTDTELNQYSLTRGMYLKAIRRAAQLASSLTPIGYSTPAAIGTPRQL